ncbi:hypothetical protein N7539_001212 [Penicillium diatomitis]|uniref:Centrosomin N-terminal motif 1 domain-containing protein n=1 Tax=Penicillium diatomitis TaxID=2819901 RepID=A0A9W9XN91_9EURO|nr:uncharacterized protein N7539_001212 [Penicillium diatomitis]KAJ5496096.1 hypothetical protein N7539_001212 [Penicillium diatomitis]
MATPWKDDKPPGQSPAVAARSSKSRAPNHHAHSILATGEPVQESRSALKSGTSHCPSKRTGNTHHLPVSRVKAGENMYTPPRAGSEASWRTEQSPSRTEARTPSRQCQQRESATPTLTNPASSLLQDLLKEQRAHRNSRGTLADDWNERELRTPDGSRSREDSSSEKGRVTSELPVDGQRQPKEMGMREMDQYVSKMNKLNFDLKLEIHHRSEQMKQLREKVQRMEEMEADLLRVHQLEEEVQVLQNVKRENQRLHEQNELLCRELDKRNLAVTEAVQLICQLEAKLNAFETEQRTPLNSSSRLVLDGPNASTPRNQIVIEIPERTSSKRSSTALNRSIRSRSTELHQVTKTPSFLREANQSTLTLRSLYAPDNNVSHSALSAMTRSESRCTLEQSPDSPRLSVLSECSELRPVGLSPEWDERIRTNLPLRRVSSTTSSVDSYIPPSKREERHDDQVDHWVDLQPDEPDTIVRRRQNRVGNATSQSVNPSFGGELYSIKPSRGRPPLDTLFGGARLPPTPDTMSTAGAPAHKRSEGSISAVPSPRPGRDQRHDRQSLERHRSVGELASRQTFNPSDSVQTVFGDTPRLGTFSPSPTFLPYVNGANQVGAVTTFEHPNQALSTRSGDPLQPRRQPDTVFSMMPRQSSFKKPRPKSFGPGSFRPARWVSPSSSPPATPTDWIAAAAKAKHDVRNMPQCNPREATGQLIFEDNSSIESAVSEPDAPEVPTLDMNALEVVEKSVSEAIKITDSPADPESHPDHRRRISFMPRFFPRASTHKRSHETPTANEAQIADDIEEDGAPSPIIPKTRTVGNARRRPLSLIITSSADTNPYSVLANEDLGAPLKQEPLHQSLNENRPKAGPVNGAATIAGRPTTSHSTETHKRRGSLSIFGWVKGMTGKRSENLLSQRAEKPKATENIAPDSIPEGQLPRAESPTPVIVPDEYSLTGPPGQLDDQGRQLRYVSRYSRRA